MGNIHKTYKIREGLIDFLKIETNCDNEGTPDFKTAFLLNGEKIMHRKMGNDYLPSISMVMSAGSLYYLGGM